MDSSWTEYISECKTRLSAIARCLYLGRSNWREKYEELKPNLEDSRVELKKRDARIEQLEVETRQLEQEIRQLREENANLNSDRDQPQPLQLPLGVAPSGQQYGEGLMALSVNLARNLGLRPAERAMKVVFDWLQVDVQVPKHPTIRMWMQRIGLSRMQNAKKAKGRVVWMADHTVQIGKEKVLTLLSTLEFQNAESGPLNHEDVEVLALVPGEEWKRENVKREYEEIARSAGIPRAIVVDGAVELREPAESLGKPGAQPLVIRDPKHFLANQFEAILKNDPQYEDFAKRLAGTRAALQQTELAHFVPPVFKIKSRFMNFAPILRWASAVLWHLDHPDSQSRRGIKAKRMREKLDWLQEFAGSIERWQVCQRVVSIEKLVAPLNHNPLSNQLVVRMKELLLGYEGRLEKGERLPMSTEVLESSFARYKQLEQQHSKSGFTSLLLAFPTLLRKTTPKEVRAAFKQVKVQDVQEWVKAHLPSTLASKRQRMYREAKSKNKKESKQSATRTTVAA